MALQFAGLFNDMLFNKLNNFNVGLQPT